MCVLVCCAAACSCRNDVDVYVYQEAIVFGNQDDCCMQSVRKIAEAVAQNHTGLGLMYTLDVHTFVLTCALRLGVAGSVQGVCSGHSNFHAAKVACGRAGSQTHVVRVAAATCMQCRCCC